MKPVSEFFSKVDFVLTDIDDTLTDEGLLGPEAYEALWKLHQAGIRVIPITGRPAGWCEMIARQWPVAGVVGENGGFYFRYHNKKMHRHFAIDEKTRFANRQKLNDLEKRIPSEVPGCDIASDQFCRLMDLAIDFCEDVPPLPQEKILQIQKIFLNEGAQAKISSIHVNGWFGQYDKLTMSLEFLQREFQISKNDALEKVVFTGDSPNDEPMFAYFPNSIGVANVSHFRTQMKSLPKYIAQNKGGLGFAEIAAQILHVKNIKN